MKGVIVLGNRMNDDGTPSTFMKTRLDLCLTFYERENPDYVIVSGGVANRKADPEAYFMKKYLTERGIPQEKIVTEDKSKTTRQNAEFSVPLALSFGIDDLTVITTKEHFERKYMNPKRYFQKFLRKNKSSLSFKTFTNE